MALILFEVGCIIQDDFYAIVHNSGLVFDGIAEMLYFVEYTFDDLVNGLNLVEKPPVKLVQTFRAMRDNIDSIIKTIIKISLDFLESAYIGVLLVDI